jgi:hypothetical protein
VNRRITSSPFAQLTEQRDPDGLARRAKALRDQLDQITGKRVRDAISTPIIRRTRADCHPHRH